MPPNSRMITLDSDIFKCCQNIHTLGWTYDQEAKRLLQHAADQVKPLMARRRWAVSHLHEFYPPAANLLGMNHNHGERIEIRLRDPRNRDIFLSEEAILGTLLHELVHIEVGPHNAAFYKLLDEITEECERDILSGGPSRSGGSNIAAGSGERLGGGMNAPRYRAAERARAAAQQRAAVRSHMRPGGRALGGGTADIAAVCDPREMALAAAENRRNDDLWCCSGGGTPSAARPIPRASPEVVEVIDLDGEPERAKAEVRAVKPTNSQSVGRGRGARRRTGAASRVPIRENPAAQAALKRAQKR